MFGHELKNTVQTQNCAAIAASGEYPLWTNKTGGPVTIVAADYRQLTAIASDATYFYDLSLHKVTALGAAHTAVAATISLISTAVTAYSPVALTLSTTLANLVIANGEGVNFVPGKTSSAPNLDATGLWTLTYVPGTGAAQ